MKLKKAHIFLAATTLTLVASLAGCGTNNSNELVSPGYTVDQIQNQININSLFITPRVASGHVGQKVQLQVTGNLSDGTQADITQYVIYTSSDPSIATVGPTGVVRGKLPGTVTITADREAGVTDSIQFTVAPFINRLFVSNFAGNSIAAFDPTSNGSAGANHVISGALTLLSGPSQMAVSEARQEIFVANSGADEVEVFYLQEEGDVAPLRHIKAAGITNPTGVAISGNELFVFGNKQIAVFNLTDGGDAVTPKRLIGGDLTLITATAGQIAIGNGQVLVPNGLTVLGFNTGAFGNVAPTRQLTGPAGLLKNAKAVSVSGTDMFVSDVAAAPTAAVYRFDVAADTITAPLSTIQGGTTGIVTPTGTVVRPAVPTELFMADVASVRVFPKTQNDGSSPIRSFLSTALSTPTSLFFADSF